MSSRELTEWMVLAKIEQEEAEHARDVAESGDGIVVVSGRDRLPEDEESDTDDGGATE